jgi:hypothetical protein
MRKLCLTLAAAAMVLSTGALTADSSAMTLGNAAGIRAAVEDVAVIDQVHCRPGWWHHRFRPHNGCFGGRRVFIAPFVVHRPHFVRRHFAHRPFIRSHGFRRW